MRTVLLVEDNVRSMEMLMQMIKGISPDILIKTACNQDEAYLLAMKNQIDLFMIDIILNPLNPGDVSGMKFADSIRTVKRYQYTPVIFITSLEDPKLYAYSDIHCYYYVEKPYDVKKVSKIISEALNIPPIRKDTQNIFFRKDGILYKKDISEIVYIENARIGRIVHFVNGSLKLPYKSCKAILEELNSDKFLQCSRYVIVNKDYIDSIDVVNRYIKLKNMNEQVEVGTTFKRKFLRDVLND